MEYTTDRLFLQDDDVKEGDWDLTVVIEGMYVDGTFFDDIDAVDDFLDVHICGESIVDVVVKYCFDVFCDVLERSARVESRDSVLDVAVTMLEFSFDVTYVTVDESVFVVDGKKDVFVTAERVMEVVDVPVSVVKGCEGTMVTPGLKHWTLIGEFSV